MLPAKAVDAINKVAARLERKNVVYFIINPFI
jgi:hypothetical protein